MNILRKSFVYLAFTALAVMGFSGCGSSSSGNAQLRVLHASPDAPNVDVAIDGHTVLTNVPYETASAYLNVSAGATHIQVFPTGTKTAAIDATVPLLKNSVTTVAAIDPKGLGSLGPVLFTDNLTPPPAGEFNVRFIHLSPSAPSSVDIYVTAVGADISTATPSISALTFPNASAYISAAAGTYEVRVTAAGEKTPAIDANVTIAAGAIRTAVALDSPGGGAPIIPDILADLN